MRFLLLFAFITHLYYVKPDGVSEEETEAAPKLEAVISEEEQKKLTESREQSDKWEYQSDVSQMMRIIVNNLYQKKDVFLRELISNAFDALDKVRFASIRNKEILEEYPEMEIKINIDPVNRLLVVSDSGIGMTKEELIKNLGTIARSGTKEFINKLSTENDAAPEITSQIGQFGVGFYSVFLVADKVLVASKSYDSDKQYIFEANTTSFNVYEDPRGNSIKRGTSIILYLNQDSSEFLKEEKIVGLVEKYSEFIQFPISIYSNLDDDKKEVPYYWKRINNVAPIWMKSPSDITEQEYEDFYNSIFYGKKKEKYAKPTGVIHFSAEGETNFRALLFIPDQLDEEYVSSPMNWRPKISLYVRRVLITGDTRPLIPHYLSHICGIVDSDDLPLNVGREMPQHSELIKVINRKVTRKILDYIKKMATNEPEKYEKFYEEFGNSLKYGIMDDESNNIRIARLLRFYSTSSKDKMISFDDYLTRFKPGQPGILFISASSKEEADKSPYMEIIRLKGYEVLYALDNIDEAVMQNLRVFENHAITNVAKEVQDIPASKEEEDKFKAKEEEYKPLLQWLKKKYYKGRVALVKLSNRLLTSSCILMAPEDGYTGSMDRIVRSQSYIHGKTAGVDQVLSKPKNLEINPYHPLVKSMFERFKENEESEQLKEDAEICFSIGTLSGGYTVEDGVKLSQMVEKLYLKQLDISPEILAEDVKKEMGIGEEKEGAEKSDESSSEEKAEEKTDQESEAEKTEGEPEKEPEQESESQEKEEL